MRIVMDVALDPTLGCGQAHRWHKVGDSWEGVLGNEVITLTQTEDGFECEGTEDRDMILDYFRAEDDLDSIYDDCARHDSFVSDLIGRCKGMRILRQPHYECIATYILATNANVKRIGAMVEGVCRTFGKDLGGRYSFPTPKEIVDGKDRICECRLGYRADRFVEFAQSVLDGRFDPDALESLSYEECVEELLTVKGVGPKVADCIALFSYGHLEAFPIDARISAVMKNVYGIEGSYKKVSAAAREMFGRYAGYSQEFLFHADFIE
ncbi:MAG: DNA glycosylase [Candidatus Methanomethylophilaceae archaeon]|nr:DNA glycosylase [Candidatus Methanomethylophilaceae archaeon]